MVRRTALTVYHAAHPCSWLTAWRSSETYSYCYTSKVALILMYAHVPKRQTCPLLQQYDNFYVSLAPPMGLLKDHVHALKHTFASSTADMPLLYAMHVHFCLQVLEVDFSDGQTYNYSAELLRACSPSAENCLTGGNIKVSCASPSSTTLQQYNQYQQQIIFSLKMQKRSSDTNDGDLSGYVQQQQGMLR